ncbi:MAG TPA: hypothetical protein VKA44_09195 [Gemmatimonadota bacterium]|nr:hypothetical protein [Gemmatimonadota bacterium]
MKEERGLRWTVTVSVDLLGALIYAALLGALVVLAVIGAACLIRGG